MKYKGKVSARIRYANRTKDDEEKRTLLKESETQSLVGELRLQPIDGLMFGGRFLDRNRNLPDIDVEIHGVSLNAFLSFSYRGWAAIRADYTFADSEYDDCVGTFSTQNHTVTSRIEINYVENLKVAGGVAYIDISEDLDIEKSKLFFETEYTLNDRYHVEVKYDVYNFDDFVLVDRYYTANVVWINIGYDFRVE